MKTKLFSKISLILATAVILGACTPNKPSESEGPQAEKVNVSAATGWDFESNAPVLDGQLVRFEDVVVTATYSPTWISVAQYEGSTADDIVMYGIEVLLAEANDGTYDLKDVVTLEGVISSTNGRPQLTDASITWGTAGQEVCEYNKDVEGTGGELWYSTIYEGRERSWFTDAGRADSSLWYELTVQMASVPSFTAGQQTSFFVVFPGENDDLTDEENYSPIQVNVPALTETQAATLNTWAEDFQVGDFLKLFAQVWFDSYAQFILPYDAFRFSATNEKTTVEGLYTDYSDVEQELFDKYTFIAPWFGTESAFSYRVSHGVASTNNLPYTSVTMNVTNGEETVVELFFNDEGNELTTEYEEYGWFIAGLFRDSSSDVLFIDMYNNAPATVTETGVEPSEQSTALIEISWTETTVDLFFLALTADAVKGGAAEGYTIETLVAAINASFAPAIGGGDLLELDEDNGMYKGGLNFGPNQATGEILLSAVQTVLGFLPMDNLNIAIAVDGSNPTAEGWEDLFGDGTPYFFAELTTLDETIIIDVYSYPYNGNICCNVEVYEA